jgi:23S rRNA (cytosine1962-C5)-methyltransferase
MTPTERDAAAAQTARPGIGLLAGRHKRVRGGHPWIYSNEVDMSAAARGLAPGTLVEVRDHAGAALGTAMFNPRSLIAARVISAEGGAVIDADFLAARIAAALALRTRLYAKPFYRLVHAEADGLPGLVIDRYGDNLVLQVGAAGMERLLPDLLAALDQVVAPAAVLLRGNGPARALEGLADETRWVAGAPDQPIEVVENGVRFLADAAGGQKTGWYFDQRENRALVARLAGGGRILDLYCYLGGFGIQAAVAGAAAVTLLDRSQPALALAERTATLAGVGEKCRFVRANAFHEMERMAKAGKRFEMVVADPPAFVKTKRDLGSGARGYRKMVRLAAALVAPQGLLFAASCSHHVSAERFADEVRLGLAAAGRDGKILYAGGAGPDHPVHAQLPESGYLKFQLLALD